MLEFQLFRIQVVYALPLFKTGKEFKKPSEILKETILAFSRAEFSKEATWRIGNVQVINGEGIYLRLGKTSKSTLEIFENGKFQDQIFETAPYTHVVIDLKYEICAIAKKTKLAPKTKTIANHFKRLLNKSVKAKELGVEFNIDEIKDPQDFIFYLKTAYAVSKFRLTFKRPNAWDVSKDFIEPLQKGLAEVDGTQGTVEVKGQELNVETLEELTRSVASTGDTAIAWLQLEAGAKKKTKKVLKENLAWMRHEDLIDEESIRRFVECMRDRYREIRQSKFGSHE